MNSYKHTSSSNKGVLFASATFLGLGGGFDGEAFIATVECAVVDVEGVVDNDAVEGVTIGWVTSSGWTLDTT